MKERSRVSHILLMRFVDQNSASWNHATVWLKQLDGLREGFA